ncbi:MAG: nucleoside hydrolase [Candidatus Glassbacteria bacterium]|nr:nucleoside hydrolase [Candidatus Glassbacteria bacterium]
MIRLKAAVLLAALLLFSGSARAAKKIIFDTDLGGDIDDAFAHALVQISPEFEVLGITVGDGPTEGRGRVSCRMLWEAGQDTIPVAVGRATRLGDNRPLQINWGDGFDRCRPLDESAADFIIRLLKKYPHQITIISVGPVTNLGDVIRKDPGAWKLVREVYSMFGSFYMGYDRGPRPSAEWNVRADVESAQLFMTSGVPITLAGLDVTTMVKFDRDRRLQLLYRNSPLTDAISALYTLWSLPNPEGRDPTLFDPVAVAMAFTDEFVQLRRAHVRVTDEGFTVVDESKPPNCKIGINISTARFIDWLTRRLLTQNNMRL